MIVEAYVYGELLDAPRISTGYRRHSLWTFLQKQVTWLAHPAAAEAAVSLLGFDKYPITWRWRSPSWPVWNHEIAQVDSLDDVLRALNELTRG
ncbi:MAG TPA: hypothetical protein VIG24_01160 [Acidimicrobiia bacterium]